MRTEESGKRVFITGASGLLGSALVQGFSKKGYKVTGHYFSKIPENISGCKWIRGDFSTLESLKNFLEKYKEDIARCNFLVNSYGPITYKESKDVTSRDLVNDFHHNVIVSKEVTDFLISKGNLKSVVNVGFEFTGEFRSYRKILPYAIAKNALYLLTVSYRQMYPDIMFGFISPVSIEGGRVSRKNGERIKAKDLAEQVIKLIEKGGR